MAQPEQPVSPAQTMSDPEAASTDEATITAETEPAKAEVVVEEESDDDEEILEESPCGRWNKRREEVKYRDVPGVDAAYLAMDTEEGVEVVWNEASFSETKKFKAQQDKLKKVFEALTLIDHPNIVKFHRFWMDSGIIPKEEEGKEATSGTKENNVTPAVVVVAEPTPVKTAEEAAEPTVSFDTPDATAATTAPATTPAAVPAQEATPKAAPTDPASNPAESEKKKLVRRDKPRLVFITEYVSSGSLKQFLRRTKKNARKTQLTSWKRWCVQILSALRYLHLNCSPPIVHGNLTCDTIFIQHNGLVKIGSVAPDIIHQNVKTCRDNIKNLHYLAPEFGDTNYMHPTTAMDIYAFGMAALEMAALEIQANEDAIGVITDDTIEKTIESLEDENQKNFIRSCLSPDPKDRPTAHQLLFHPVLFEVHSCKLLAAHKIVNLPEFDTTNINETMNDKAIQALYGTDSVLAFIKKNEKLIEFKLKDFPSTEKLEKFIEDVKNGIYPITAFGQKNEYETSEQPVQGTASEEGKSDEHVEKTRVVPEYEPEMRRCYLVHATIYFTNESNEYNMSLLLKLEDAMNRQLYCTIDPRDSSKRLVDELVFNAFVTEADGKMVVHCLDDCFRKLRNEQENKSDDESEELRKRENVAQLKTFLLNSGDPHIVAEGITILSSEDESKHIPSD